MGKIISVKVTSRAKAASIIEDLEGNLKVKVKSPPVDGRANEELIGLLADFYKLPRSRIQIIKGLTSKQKTIKIFLKLL